MNRNLRTQLRAIRKADKDKADNKRRLLRKAQPNKNNHLRKAQVIMNKDILHKAQVVMNKAQIIMNKDILHKAEEDTNKANNNRNMARNVMATELPVMMKIMMLKERYLLRTTLTFRLSLKLKIRAMRLS